MRYHVKESGEPAPCHASVQTCPRGGESEHYSTEKEARKAFEESMNNVPTVVTRKPRLRLGRRIAAATAVVAVSFSISGCDIEDIRLPEYKSYEDTKRVEGSGYGDQVEEHRQRAEEALERLNEERDNAEKVLEDTQRQVQEELDKIEEGEIPLPELPETPAPDPGPAPGSASTTETLAKLNKLEVKGRAPMTGYDRDSFMTSSEWDDARQKTLQRDFTNIVYRDDGKVFSGDLDDPYTGTQIHYEIGGASEVDVDHVVALGDAWSSGIQYQSDSVRTALATDPENLLAVQSSANRQKSDSNAASWLPSNKAYRCDYVSTQISVKFKYDLWVTSSEYDALKDTVNKYCE